MTGGKVKKIYLKIINIKSFELLLNKTSPLADILYPTKLHHRPVEKDLDT